MEKEVNKYQSVHQDYNAIVEELLTACASADVTSHLSSVTDEFHQINDQWNKSLLALEDIKNYAASSLKEDEKATECKYLVEESVQAMEELLLQDAPSSLDLNFLETALEEED